MSNDEVPLTYPLVVDTIGELVGYIKNTNSQFELGNSYNALKFIKDAMDFIESTPIQNKEENK